VRAWAKLDDIDKFDAAFFGMSPRDAAVFDPQHRFFLECAWEAFENAGYLGERPPGPVGVFAACGLGEYMIKNVLTNEEIVATVGEWLIRHTGNDTNFLATRASYELGLQGPSMNVQTACSSSLVAIHLACQSLLAGECEMALAGGSTISAEQNKGYFYKEGEILSPDGHCRAFDAKSAGTTIGSATGCIVLRRLDDALAAGDNVLAIIRGSAINNDGRDKVGYLAPSVSGQARVVSEALAIAGIDARDVEYVEAHGTGTLIGDPIEIAGLTQAFRQSTNDKQFCAVGSLKTNIGHAGEASGAAGFIKVALALANEEIPPSLHFEEPNPEADFPNSPFFVNAKLRPWKRREGSPRIAGITGLGAGGTNAHILLEEAPLASASGPSRSHQLVTIAARTQTALDRATLDLAAHLRAHPDANLADVAFTRLAGRKAFRHRRAIVGADVASAATALEAHESKSITHHHKRDAPSLVFMFPGGGAQYAGMGRDLYEREPVYRRAIDACATLVNPRLGIDLRTVMFPKGDVAAASARLERPSLALPALFATEYAIAKLLESWGITPAAMLGHSAGEYVAATLAGVISMPDGLSLVALRGRLFETLPKGGMISVSLSEEEARARMPEGLSIAAMNAPSLSVVSGPIALIDAFEKQLAEGDVEHTRIHIDVAAHSSMLEPILAEFGAFCRTIRFSAPKTPYVSNLTGTWIEAKQATDPKYWVRHLREAVRFGEGVEAVLADPNRVLVEIGPGRTLTSLARSAKTKAHAAASTLRHPNEEASDVAFLLTTLGRIWTAGVDLDASKLYADERRHRVPMPTYPFERQRYWVEPGKRDERASTTGPLRKRGDVRAWFYTPSWRRTASPKPVEWADATWLVISPGVSGNARFKERPLAERIAERLRAIGRAVVMVTFGPSFLDKGEDGFVVDPTKPRDWIGLIEALRERGPLPTRIVHAAGVDVASKIPFFSGRPRALAAFETTGLRDYGSLVYLAQALAEESEPMRLAVVTTGAHAVATDHDVTPDRALLHGACRVLPRELSHLSTIAIDVDVPDAPHTEARLLDRLTRELLGDATDDVVAIRRGERWTRSLDAVPLEPTTPGAWAVERGAYLITGGLGGIGLAVAEHLAKTVKARLILVGRTPLPPERDWGLDVHDDATRDKIRRVQAMRALGAEVMLASADVTDARAMSDVVAQARARFGRIHGVVHSAGVLRDRLVALRVPSPSSDVIDVKVKGALVLDAALAADPPDVFVVFSSVSSLIGLPGQADYTAANAFLDAFAVHKSATGKTRGVSVNWNAWQEVGMAVALAREEREGVDEASTTAEARAARRLPQPPRPARATRSADDAIRPLLEEVTEDGEDAIFSTAFTRKRHWLVGEHVVKGGEALIPGTGFLELSRAAIDDGQASARAVELRDVFFLAPFIVRSGEARTLYAKLRRASNEVVFYSDSESAPHATARVAHLDHDIAPRLDLGAIRARCALRTTTHEGFSDQPFMDFGPRWGSLRRIDYGPSEALVALEMPPDFVRELAAHPLHPGLLDVATGSAQALIPGFTDAAFYVPFSYARVIVRRALTAKSFCHIRYREGSARDLAVFDVSICDEAGEEVVAVQGYAMRRIADASVISTATSRAVEPPARRVEKPIESALREGILSHEGVDALDRIMTSEIAPQVVASSVDLHRWIAQVDEEQARARAPRGTATSSDGVADAGRPNLSASFVAPRTPIERELASIWRELLGVENIGANDDFFELGGQSLIAVRMFGRVRKKYGVDLPIATLFDAPTIASSAALLAEHLGVADLPDVVEEKTAEAPKVEAAPIAAAGATKAPRKFRSLVQVQRGDAARAPFFCVHGAGGNVLNFRDLARAMDRGQPFYGLQARGVDGALRPHTSIDEMALAYLEEIRAHEPRGPYLLGGYSGGGVVALAMADLLTQQGEEVALLAFIDTYHPQMPIRRVTMSMRFERLRDEGLPYVRRAFEGNVARLAVKRQLAQIAQIAATSATMPSELRELHLTDNFERVAARYVPKPWDGRATLLRASEVGYIYQDGGAAYGWENVIRGGVDVVRVPGNHDNLLLEPNATVLVKSLGTALDRAQQQVRAAAR
jgi:acyl transferase domain-containing protein/thioesterase domain-containing protein/acyl carrier protein